MYQKQLRERIQRLQSVLCIGLDGVYEKLPASIKADPNPLWRFNQNLIEATHDLACCYKANFAFYIYRGEEGVTALGKTIRAAHAVDVPVILDVKWGDIGHTAEYYAKAAFEAFYADAVTLNPYMGEESIAPFRDYDDRGCYVLCFTSNASRRDLQTRKLASDTNGDSEPMYRLVADKIKKWNKNGNLGAVAGATAPEELAEIRETLGPDISILCPGVGVQGGDLEEVLFAGDARSGNLVINVSRAIINASAGADFAEAARREAEMFVDQSKTFFNQPIEDQED
ncbi:MAG: orotidine-5'-phosphate decarboxylase [bacterium]|nr:orotidine-5'-phosphate decarboxylase [bacterium]